MLHVVDAETRADLSEVSVAEILWISPDGHPGTDHSKALVEHASSPLPLPVKLGGLPDALLVWAPEHAWGRIDLSGTAREEFMIALPRSATLEVHLENQAALATYRALKCAPCLTMRERDPQKIIARTLKENADLFDADFADGRRPSEAEVRTRVRASEDGTGERVLGEVYAQSEPDPSGVTLFADVAPGSYLLTLENAAILAEAPVDLRAGERRSIVLTIADPPVASNAPLAGTLLVPSSWNVGESYRPKITVLLTDMSPIGFREIDVPRDKVRAIDGSPGSYDWDVGQVPVGHYSISLDDPTLTCGEQIDVPVSGRTDVRLVVAEPADVSLQVLDTERGLPIEVTEVRSGLFCWGSGANWNATTKSYFIRVASGSATLTITDRDRSFTRTFDVNPGRNEISFTLPRPCGIVLYCHDGAQRVRWPRHPLGLIDVATSERPTQSDVCAYDDSDLGIRITTETPGRHVVSIRHVEGFEPTAPFEIDVPPGQFVEREVHMTRTPR
jgi:hypothetical protein